MGSRAALVSGGAPGVGAMLVEVLELLSDRARQVVVQASDTAGDGPWLRRCRAFVLGVIARSTASGRGCSKASASPMRRCVGS